jgi:predicted nucleic acid-binding protein
MAPSAPIHRVVLDANVLYPASLRDLLLRCAEKELYRLQLSQDIWTEVVRNLVDAGRMTSAQAARLDAAIGAFLRRSDALVTGYEPLIPTLTNDPKDRHVLAVAIHAHAHIIVTVNLKHFPASALAPHGIVAQHSDAFLTHLHASHAEILTQIVREQVADLKNPPLSVADVLDTLAQHVPTTVSLLQTAIAARGEPSDSLG